jgi:hypothetical protein
MGEGRILTALFLRFMDGINNKGGVKVKQGLDRREKVQPCCAQASVLLINNYYCVCC